MGSKRIKLNDAANNMIIAKDIISKTGAVIALKESVLSADDIEKLKLNGIEYILVYEDEKIHDKSIVERKEFKKFIKIYKKNVEAVKKCFTDIYNGKNIDANELFLSATDIVEKLNCKSDVINYIYHLKEFDDYTYRHSINVAVLCYLFAEWTDMSSSDKKTITLAGIMHDIGKIMVSDDILNKNGKLTKDEFDEIKKHTNYGYMLLFNQNLSNEVKLAALMHHEKIDGTGYPFGVSDNKIDKFSKIVAICDIYDAMTNDRVYHSKKCPFDVIKDFEQNCYGSLDIESVVIFTNHIAHSYLGCKVILSNEQEAEVVFINKSELSKPIVKQGEKFVNLLDNSEIYIKELI